MTPKQMQAALDKFGLTQAEGATMLGLSARAMRYYVNGQREIPLPTAKLIRLALAGKITIADIQKA
jgi:transcriptional regulator with XRE-family HTH domain